MTQPGLNGLGMLAGGDQPGGMGVSQVMNTARLAHGLGEMFGSHPFAAGHGYGFGVAVVVDPETADPTICGGEAGAVGWPGAYGGWWQADPNDRSVMILLTHNMVTLDQLAHGIGLGARDAITQFQRLVSTLLAAQ